jgi:hypothetical protein
MYEMGGNGFGTLYTTLRAFGRRYKHDRDSLSKWLAILEEEGLVWREPVWPDLVIHISAISPPPRAKAHLGQRIRARASAAKEAKAPDVAETSRQGVFFGPKAKTRTIGGKVPHEVPTTSARVAEVTRTSGGTLPPVWRNPSASGGGTLPPDVREMPASVAEPFRQSGGTLPPVVRKVPASDNGSEPVKSGANPVREELQEKGDIDMKGGGEPPPQSFAVWKKGLGRMFDRELRQLAKDLEGKLEGAQTDAARAEWRKRLKAVREQITGGPVPDQPEQKAESKKQKAAPAPAKTEQELIDEARQMLADGEAIGVKVKLPPAHAAAWKKASPQ